ncbi:hypothetical protein FPSE_00443 [Fusarium pseudograminearum CS3096]|uniref:Uncharacterized protein n=1 Tax=Fusarium pseudograminearum (strain CS3096) TaxID=1028729 RepID=K3V2C4_FUSPC|nr:hypothetical protein FPSE_00443 [Fusarium pseudograminearum CS3096]EKJ79401.1 hypothetical protein FPSE_00443 [Fusarium pseudograminearum CS3096]
MQVTSCIYQGARASVVRMQTLVVLYEAEDDLVVTYHRFGRSHNGYVTLCLWRLD